MKNHVWMLISQDKYELPLAVADTAGELARIINDSSNNIRSSYNKYKQGQIKTCRFRKVTFDEQK